MEKESAPLAIAFQHDGWEAGLDEAGRGCLAGPVVAAAVVLPLDFEAPAMLTDSKKLTHAQRMSLRPLIHEAAVAWSIGMMSPQRIDEVNILNATYEAMHEALDCLGMVPDHLAVDGNRFRPYQEIAHTCLVKGDSRFANIAAASILAKTYRDELMQMLHQEYGHYSWDRNKGYPTRAHKLAIQAHGPTPHHRKSFNWQPAPSLFD